MTSRHFGPVMQLNPEVVVISKSTKKSTDYNFHNPKPNLCPFQLLKCENLLLLFVFMIVNGISLGFGLLVEQNKLF